MSEPSGDVIQTSQPAEQAQPAVVQPPAESGGTSATTQERGQDAVLPADTSTAMGTSTPATEGEPLAEKDAVAQLGHSPTLDTLAEMAIGAHADEPATKSASSPTGTGEVSMGGDDSVGFDAANKIVSPDNYATPTSGQQTSTKRDSTIPVQTLTEQATSATGSGRQDVNSQDRVKRSTFRERAIGGIARALLRHTQTGEALNAAREDARKTPDQRVAALLARQPQGTERVVYSQQERAQIVDFARQLVPAEFIGADGSKTPLDIGSLNLSEDQARQLRVLVEEAQIASLRQSQDPSEKQQGDTEFGTKNQRQLVVRKEANGSITVISLKGVEGSKFEVDEKTGQIKAKDSVDLKFTFNSANIHDGKLTTTADGNPTVDLSKQRVEGQNADIADAVRDAASHELIYFNQLRQMDAFGFDESVSDRNARMYDELKKAQQGRISDGTVSVPSVEVNKPDLHFQYRVVDVQRASDLQGENGKAEARERMIQRLEQVIQLQKTGEFENGKVPTVYVGKEDFRKVAQEISVEGVKIPDRESPKVEGEAEPKIPLLVTADQKAQLDGLTRKGRADVFASQGMQDPEKYDVQIYDLDAQESASVDKTTLLNETAGKELKKKADTQTFLEQAIMDGDIDVRIREDADIALQMLNIKPNLAYTEGNGITTRGVLGADRAAQVLELRIQNTFKEINPNNSRSMREIAREQFAIMAKELGITDEKQLEQWNAIRDRDYPLSDGEHIAKARAINRDIKNGQTVEQWRQAVEAELALATDLTEDDQRSILNDITTPKIDTVRVLAIRTKIDLDAYDEELKPFGGLPESIKNSVRLDEDLTDDMIAGVAGNYEERKRLEERFGSRLTEAQKKLLEFAAPVPQEEKTLEQRIIDGTATIADLDAVAKLFGFNSGADLLATRKQQDQQNNNNNS